eukprot:1463696-Prymnesium_polylepis.2
MAQKSLARALTDPLDKVVDPPPKALVSRDLVRLVCLQERRCPEGGRAFRRVGRYEDARVVDAHLRLRIGDRQHERLQDGHHPRRERARDNVGRDDAREGRHHGDAR